MSPSLRNIGCAPSPQRQTRARENACTHWPTPGRHASPPRTLRYFHCRCLSPFTSTPPLRWNPSTRLYVNLPPKFVCRRKTVHRLKNCVRSRLPDSHHHLPQLYSLYNKILSATIYHFHRFITQACQKENTKINETITYSSSCKDGWDESNE